MTTYAVVLTFDHDDEDKAFDFRDKVELEVQMRLGDVWEPLGIKLDRVALHQYTGPGGEPYAGWIEIGKWVEE